MSSTSRGSAGAIHQAGKRPNLGFTSRDNMPDIHNYLTHFEQRNEKNRGGRRMSSQGKVAFQHENDSSTQNMEPDTEEQRRAISMDVTSMPSRGKEHILCPDYISIKSVYRFGAEIGDGASGVVRKCFRDNSPFACKTILKASLKSRLDIEDLKLEVKTLQIMQMHPSVVRLKGLFEDSSKVHLMMECCEGGDLFTRIKERKFFTEPEAAMVCGTVASVIALAHSHGIMHRDIKPENILLASKYSDTDIRVADFGSASFFKPGQTLNQLVGSPLYIAPSVLQCRYGTEADLWSLGVVLYVLLSGEPPFWGPSNAEVFKAVQFGQLSMEKRRWTYVSPAAKELVRKLLNRDTSRAMTAQQVLEDPWIQIHCGSKFSAGLSAANVDSRRRAFSTLAVERLPVWKSNLNDRPPARHRRFHSHDMTDLWCSEESYASQHPNKGVLARVAAVPSGGLFETKWVEDECGYRSENEDDSDYDVPVAEVLPAAVGRSSFVHISANRSCKGETCNMYSCKRHFSSFVS